MPDIKELFKEQNDVFEKFRKANDLRLEELEAKGNTDPLLEAKVDKLNAALGELETEMQEIIKKARRPGSMGDELSEDVVAHQKAYGDWLRKGNDVGLVDLERKALNVTTPEAGGFAVPEELDRSILTLMQAQSPMRSVCNVVIVGTPDYKKLVSVGGLTYGWVDEEDRKSVV